MTTIDEDPELFVKYRTFVESRAKGLVNLFQKGEPFWEKHYMKGQHADGGETSTHRSRYNLKPFIVKRLPPAASPPKPTS